MAKTYDKNKPEDAFSKAQKFKDSRPKFTIKDKEFYIQKWPHLELWDRIPIVANLFFVPMTVGLEQDEFGEMMISEASILNTLFQRLQEQDVPALLKDLTSCVYVSETNEVIDLDKDLEDQSDICIVLREVFKHCFLFLFNGGFTEILQLGSEIRQVSQTVSQGQ